MWQFDVKNQAQEKVNLAQEQLDQAAQALAKAQAEAQSPEYKKALQEVEEAQTALHSQRSQRTKNKMQ